MRSMVEGASAANVQMLTKECYDFCFRYLLGGI